MDGVRASEKSRWDKREGFRVGVILLSATGGERERERERKGKGLLRQ